MTAYELLDIRSSVSESYMSTMKFWATVTFAVFGAGNFAGASTSALSFVLLFVFYVGVSIGLGLYSRQLRLEISAVESDLVTSASGDSTSLLIVSPKIVQSRNMSVGLQWVCLLGAPIILAFYLYQQFLRLS
jgi:hypothetical protein